VTIYKSLGIAAQDLAAATVILDRAEAQGAGQLVDF
jgi:ornithine cyclodeaminase/alanine dehydrogenase-like protein (mu-crystallin family)